MNRRTLVVGSVVMALAPWSKRMVYAKVEPDKRGGLGLTGKEWIKLWGKPDVTPESGIWKAVYQRWGLQVKLIYLESDQQIISFDVDPVFQVSQDRVLPNIEHFFPDDSQRIDEYPRPTGPGTVLVYNSTWLAERFLALHDPVVSNWFPGGNPGDFIVILQENDAAEVEHVIVALGNNP